MAYFRSVMAFCAPAVVRGAFLMPARQQTSKINRAGKRSNACPTLDLSTSQKGRLAMAIIRKQYVRRKCDPVEVERIWAERGGVKRCTKCGHTKQRDQFKLKATHSDGTEYHCKDCRNADDRAKRQAAGILPRAEYVATVMRRLPTAERMDRLWRALEISNARQAWDWWLDHAPTWWTAERERIQRDLTLAKYAEASHRKRARNWNAPIGKSSTLGLARLMWAATECHWCGRGLTKYEGGKYRPTDATYDHVVPLSKRGEHSLANLVVACGQCNFHRAPEDWGVGVAA